MLRFAALPDIMSATTPHITKIPFSIFRALSLPPRKIL